MYCVYICVWMYTYTYMHIHMCINVTYTYINICMRVSIWWMLRVSFSWICHSTRIVVHVIYVCVYRSDGCVWHGCVWHGCVWHGCVWHGCVWHGCVWHASLPVVSVPSTTCTTMRVEWHIQLNDTPNTIDCSKYSMYLNTSCKCTIHNVHYNASRITHSTKRHSKYNRL